MSLQNHRKKKGENNLKNNIKQPLNNFQYSFPDNGYLQPEQIQRQTIMMLIVV